jgi:sterol desaturase/sphingolipid hydroxylase (fatty acid hydroxylase superfamily)
MSNQLRTVWTSTGFARSLYTDECLETIENWEGMITEPSPENRRKEGIRVFRNGFIEQVLSKAHPLSPALWVFPLGGYGLYRGFTEGYSGFAGTLGLFFVGVLLWTLIEYLLHRFVFHLRPKSPSGKIRAFMVHGYHHEFPNDKMRLVAPPLMSGTFGIIAALLYYLIFGPNYWLQVFAGTTIGYLMYDWTHYYTHHFHPKTHLGRWVRRYHLLHHYKHDPTRFGISSPLWDLVFGTYRSPDKAQYS